MISTDEIREILARRVDQQKQAVGMVVGVIDPGSRRVIAYGHLAKGDSRTLDVHIRRLRQKLGDPALIETVTGVGYRLVANERKSM